MSLRQVIDTVAFQNRLPTYTSAYNKDQQAYASTQVIQCKKELTRLVELGGRVFRGKDAVLGRCLHVRRHSDSSVVPDTSTNTRTQNDQMTPNIQRGENLPVHEHGVGLGLPKQRGHIQQP
jgi:hypothetical protein